MRKHISLLFMVILTGTFLQLPAYARSDLRAIYKPPVMKLSGDLSLGAISEAIHRATANRDWKTRKIGENKLRATYKKTGKVGVVYIIEVDISYSKKAIKFAYHSSRDLDYQKHSQLINGHYNNWLKKLEKEIWKEVNR